MEKRYAAIDLKSFYASVECRERNLDPLTTNLVVADKMFTDYAARQKEQEEKKALLEREKNLQKAMLEIKKKFGKNAILKGISFEEGATARKRNEQIGGHKA